jgi:ribosomal protein S18 acetylase RimI-like enzyme
VSRAPERSLELLDGNLAGIVRHLARHGGGATDETPNRLLVSGGHSYPGPLINAAIRTDRAADPGQVVRDATQFFAARDRGFVLWAGAHGDQDLVEAALAGGLVALARTAGSICMVLTEPPAPGVLPHGAALTEVTDAETVAEFAGVLGEAFATLGQPEDVPRVMFANPATLLAPEVTAFLVRTDSVPVSCALLFESPGGAGLYFVGTVPAARGAGNGEAVTRAAAIAAFARGAPCVILDATVAAVPLYRRVGFREVSRYDTYGPAR